MTMMRSRRTAKYALQILGPYLLAMLVVPLGAGCRTYGGYQTEDKTVTAIEQINEQFARSLARAEGELVAMREAAEADPGLVPAAEVFGSAVSLHAELLDSHRADFERLMSGWTGYRASSRLLGSIITDHHRMANRYRSAVAQAGELAGRLPVAVRARALYQQVPPYYARLENRAAELDVGDIVRQGS